MLATPVVVLDFETTGLSPHVDRVTEVAALRIVGARIVDRYVTLVNPGIAIPAEITAFTGISNAMVANAPSAQRVMPELVQFIGSHIVVAHNASFDHGFLRAECGRAGLSTREFQTLCTMRLARRLLPDIGSYRLAAVAAKLRVTFPSQAHRAEADSIVAAEVLLKMASIVKEPDIVAEVDPELLCRITGWPKLQVTRRLAAFRMSSMQGV
jgi:DNA polymerase III subunit epsilon